MGLSISLVVLTGIIAFVLVRTGYQLIWPGVTCVLFGFSLASTGIAPGINSAIQTVASWVNSL